MAEHDVILEMKNISKSFPGVKALDNVSFALKKGTVHALMGENGAGKSTLMKCAFGLYFADEGEIILEGRKVNFHSPLDGIQNGITMIHQELNPVLRRSMAENIWIGRIPVKKILGFPVVDHKKLYADTQELFDKLNMKHINPRTQPIGLSASIVQLGEIARAVSYGSKVIIMDEPTSSLTYSETEILFDIIRRLTSEGVAIVYISHKIDEILRISDQVTILRDGKSVGTWTAGELTPELIVNRMVGREMANWFPELDNTPGEVIMEVENYTSVNPFSFKNCSFNLRKGEILGIGGLVGSQRTELVEGIFGIRNRISGTIKINGKEVAINNSVDAIDNKMGLLTEERRATGIIAGLTVMDNMTVASLKKNYSNKLGFLKLKKMVTDSEEYVRHLRIRTPSLRTRILDLSGGNQQKVLVARWLMSHPDILILDEPTRGIDVGAKFEIYTIMLDLAKEGKAVLMISSEMPELIGMSNRILVMCEGQVSGILDGKTATEEKVMEYASKVGGLGEDA